MKLVTLIDNYTRKKGVYGEHGFSIYIDTGTTKILFDTGQTGAVVSNASILGVDLSALDCIVLSHGHYDHTGGLDEILQICPSAKVYFKDGLFLRKYNPRGEWIGFPGSRERIKNPEIVKTRTAVADHVFLNPSIPLKYPKYSHFAGFTVENNGVHSEDCFDDELFLTIETDGLCHIITGCSHRGFVNIIDAAKCVSGMDIGYVIGGFHFTGGDIRKNREELEIAAGYGPSGFYAGHCTGLDGYGLLKERFGDKVFYNSAGTVIEI